jgi:exosortase
LSRTAAVAVCSVAGLAIFQFWGNATHGYIATNSLFYWWCFQWVNPRSETEHAWLILGLSLFLLWQNLRRGGAGTRPVDSRSAAAVLGGLLLHAVGFIAQQPRVSIVALLVFLWGLLSLAGGLRWSRASLFPLGFMVFAIPVNALDTVGFWLQMWVVQDGAKIAHLAGIGVIRNGTQLIAPDGRYQYDVVAACSGIRSLMALTALSLVIGYLWFKPPWLRGAMLLASLPLVYLGNVIRISSIIFAAQFGGQAWGNRVHDVMGYAIFVIVVGGVIGIAELLQRMRPAWTMDAAPAETLEPAPMGAVPIPMTAAVALLAVAEAAFLSHRIDLPPDERTGVALAPDGANPKELPTYLGSEWMGQHVEPAPIEREILPPDTGFSRKKYVNLEKVDQSVLLSIVLSGRDRTSIHRPELCLVGQGWTIDQSSLHHFDYPGIKGAGFDATVLSVHHEVSASSGTRSVPDIVVYWFVGADRIFATQAGRMAYDAWCRVSSGKAPRWAYVFLQTDSADGLDAALGRIQAILDASLPAFQPAVAPGSLTK